MTATDFQIAGALHRRASPTSWFDLNIFTAATLAETTTTAIIATYSTMNSITAKTAGIIVAATLVAGTGTYLVQQRETNRLRSENQTLATTNLRLSNERDAALSTATASHDELERLQKEKNELLRLRGEVGLLRKQASETTALKAENLRLRTTSSAQQSKQTPAEQTEFPKDSWTFSGYSSPATAMQTWVWAMNKGDKEMMLASLVPEELDTWRKNLEGVSSADLSKGSPFVAYRVVSTEAISDTIVHLTIVSDFPDGRKTGAQKYKLIKIGADWKMAGQAGN